jgi:VIT1/CCC1 family predicted Fe2+/Mn2+ transporter
MRHDEHHRSGGIGWLRAAVLGANHDILSTSSLVLGVAGSGAEKDTVVLAGIAGLVAGALSMAAGEHVSVSSQADTQDADLARERHELATNAAQEHVEPAGIYVARGLKPLLADQGAEQLMAHGALAAHALDELGISELQRARPPQAALASAATFAIGASLPLFAGEPLRVTAYPILVSQAILNLERNSIDATSTGGPDRRQVRLETRQAGRAAEVIVTDSGPALSPDVASRLVETFVTTKPDGLGMGLSISQSIVEAHGGQLRHAEAPGGGCTFTLTLPGIDP